MRRTDRARRSGRRRPGAAADEASGSAERQVDLQSLRAHGQPPRQHEASRGERSPAASPSMQALSDVSPEPSDLLPAHEAEARHHQHEGDGAVQGGSVRSGRHRHEGSSWESGRILR